jgi:DNA-binding XRE family transcriptional regulator
MGKRASRRRIIRPPKVEKIKKPSLYARYDDETREPRNQFEALRRSLHISQEVFGEKLGLTRQCIQHYETDRSFPTVATWHTIKEKAKQHGIELDDAILNEFLQKKLAKKKEMIERRYQEKLEQMNASFNKKMSHLNEVSQQKWTKTIQTLQSSYQEPS